MENQTFNDFSDEKDRQTKKQMSKRDKNNMIAGIVLIIMGVLFFIKKYFDISFSDYWPVIFIIIGIVFVFYSIKGKGNQN